MYFASRLQAGRLLADKIVPKYRYENCVVVGLGDGGVMVGVQLASALHCAITMIMSQQINAPRESIALGGISQDGTFSYNKALSSGEIDEWTNEYRNYIEQEKLTKLHEMNKLIGNGGLTSLELLKGHNVFLVSDGFPNAFQLDMAMEFMKPIQTDRIIVATPLASVQAVDRMHIVADEIFCLDVPAEYVDTDHYYDQHDVPDHETVIETIKDIVLKWQ